ncbi:GGDEF domain-containing protein [Pseudomonas palleroniana]|uniref:diguanylate cyclase n=1 Tax=Pseudomonas palleroniana TaxID=191390 RepID=A0A1H5IBJ3_9PSED|nr:MULTISPECIES: sensor domain-containing diguanylate cyclase [Pseudomonas]KAB0567176.1 GGDEF domain-containing protein [Pseudomonas palleroniana]MBM9487210.1 GGDEF domain-containing protein [Pseudomonas sp. ICBG1301]PTC26668.1 GGDEF domain-containing protein [Pseudomonas palleroniana]SEE37593.1 diguanylate cyclase (GGDEF) domain-containing protein [Pseudomonas palleroniana]
MSQPRTRKLPVRSELLLLLGSSLTVILIVVIVTALLSREHASTLQAAKRMTTNIAQLINADVLRNVELYDLALQGLIAATSYKDLTSVPADIRHLVQFDQSNAAPFKGEVLLLDANGAVIADSSTLHPTRRNFADRDYFLVQQQNPDAGLFISRPFKIHCDCEQVWRIAFSRRVSGPNGEFAGVAVATMRLAYFDQLFNRLTIGSGSSVNLLSNRGILLAQQPLLERDMIDKDLSDRPNFKRMLREGEGSFQAVSTLTGIERLYTFTNVGDLPLIVVVALSSEDVFAPWKRAALLTSGATGVLCIGLLWLTWMLRRELRRRYRAEQVLSELAATDALTGLANRRVLDQRLQLEWDRAQRSTEPLTLLMIDVDHFKAFNDRHGHHGGDEALRTVAQVISDNIRRPADLAARYGGEEFAVVLPHTDVKGAWVIAEHIRSSVEHLPLVPGAEQPITVSIGMSTWDKHSHMSLETLLLSADQALYEAKYSGRNRIAMSE